MSKPLPRLAALACLMLPTAAAAAENWADNPDPSYKASQAICRAAKATPLPPAPAAKPAKDCESDALLHGTAAGADGRPDPQAARACAYREMAADEGFGAGTLATIYADGLGVPRDYDVAIRFACVVDGAPAEMDGRVTHLASLRAAAKEGKPPPATPFDVCDDVTSGMWGGACAQRDGALKDIARAKATAALTAGLDAGQRAAFAKLATAQRAFTQASLDNEVDTSGTGRVGFMVASQQGHDESYLNDLRAVLGKDATKAPPSDASDASDAAADKALNATYAKVMRQKDEDYPGAVKKAGVKATQRAWLAYRDSFLAFAAAVKSPLPREALAARLTAERTKDLGELVSSR